MGSRLSALDHAFLQVEDAENRMQLAGMLLFSGEPPSFGEFREAVAERLLGLPRFKQRLSESMLGLARPRWVDDRAFALDYHVSRVALPAPGGHEEVAAHIDHLTSSPLDLRRPLWEIGLVEGLEDGFGVSLKVHHCMVDGLSIIDIFAALLAPDSRLPTVPVRFASHERPSRWVSPLAAATTPANGLVTVASMLRQAPATPFNRGMSGPTRKTAYITVPLEDIHELRRAYETTVNNAVLAVVSGGLRRYLLRHDAMVDKLHAFVPVNVRSGRDRDALGNQIAMTYPALPVGEPDADARVRSVIEAVRQTAESGQAVMTAALMGLTGLAPAPVAGAINRALQFWSGIFNVTVTNVPGPPVAAYFLGRRLELILGSTPLTRRHALTVAVLSYNGSLTFMVTTDPHRVPDGESLADDFRAELADLRKRAKRGKGANRG